MSKKTKKTRTSGRKKRTKKPKVGEPFEKRAQHALQCITPELDAKHDVKLTMPYGAERQFDVGLRDGPDQYRRLFEAKDYGRRVGVEKVEALETKLRDLEHAPLEFGGLVSPKGFQSGAVKRTRHFRDKALVRQLLQLREVEEADWEHRFKSVGLAANASVFEASDVRLELLKNDDSRNWESAASSLSGVRDRVGAYLYDKNGDVVGNLLDRINDAIWALQKADAEPPEEVQEICFEPPAFMHFGDQQFAVACARFRVVRAERAFKSSISLSSAVRDTLIDVLEQEKWLIPDPEKALGASRNGMDVELTFEPKQTASLDELSLPRLPDGRQDRIGEVVTALQFQILLTIAGREKTKCDRSQNPEFVDKLERAMAAMSAGEFNRAKELYWETCSEATSLVALTNLAFMYSEEGDADRSLWLCARAVELFPLEVEGYANCMAVLQAGGRFEEAHRVLDAARCLHAGHPALLRQEADLLVKETSFTEAAELYVQLFHMDRSNASVRANLAYCVSAQGHHREAAWDALQAWQIAEKGDAEVGLLAVRLLNRAGRFEEAFLVSDELGAEPQGLTKEQHRRLALERGKSAYETGRIAVLGGILCALSVAEGDRVERYLRGLHAHATSEFALAAEHFEAAQKAGWRGSAAATNCAICLANLGRFEGARDALRDVEGERDSRYWEIRCLVSARLGDLGDVELCVRMLPANNVASVLVEAADEAVQGRQRALAAKLWEKLANVASDDPRVNAQQALTKVDHLLDGRTTEAEIREHLRVAELAATSSNNVVFARALLAVRTGDREHELHAALHGVLNCNVGWPQVLLLACELDGYGREEDCLHLLDDYKGMRFAVPELPDEEAVRSSALVGLGRDMSSVIASCRSTALEREHPMHRLMRAVEKYYSDDLAGAGAELDAMERMVGGRLPPFALLLLLQCLVESGRYAKAAQVVASTMPGSPVDKLAEWWSREGDVSVEESKTMVQDIGGLPAFLGDKRADHVGLLRGQRIVAPVEDWSAGFSQLKQLSPDGIPVLVRITPPLRTLQRLKHAGLLSVVEPSPEVADTVVRKGVGVLTQE